MRVIAGQARGLVLEAPGNLPIRPTLDRVREALFSILMPRLEGAHVLDLFAGTGANGIEALSRGAVSATFVDADPRVIALIHRNLATTRLHTTARVLLGRIPEELSKLADGEHQYDLIYVDPPHDFGALPPLLERIHGARLLAIQGMVVLEHATNAVVPHCVASWACVRQAHYGRTTLSFFSE